MDESLFALTHDKLASARRIVGAHVPVSSAYRWPLIEQATGTETWIKHENHNPTGAFKVRGGLTYMTHLVEAGPARGVISASRGNHSQSLAFAGAVFGVPVTIV
ncbi:MAG: pyridoxal-phosphate dependent enzyme, partial [Propionibacteriaceae bacterium]|nr:pyridoxal-phosphate dependent enzyme [Propionibacteriaceae bacterium]